MRQELGGGDSGPSAGLAPGEWPWPVPPGAPWRTWGLRGKTDSGPGRHGDRVSFACCRLVFETWEIWEQETRLLHVEGARVSDLLSVRPGPVQPVVWLRGREQGHAPRDRSPGPRPLKAGRGSRCDSADNRGASVALLLPSRAPSSLLQARAIRHPWVGPVPQAPVLYVRSEIRTPEHETLRSVGAPKKNQTAQEVVLKKRLHIKLPNQRIPKFLTQNL